MEVTLLNWFVAFILLAVLFSFLILISAILERHFKTQTGLDSILGASTIVFLLMLAEVYSLSLIPIATPLRYLPLYHGLIHIFLFYVVIKSYGWKGLKSYIRKVFRDIVQPFQIHQTKLAFYCGIIIAVIILGYLGFAMFTGPSGWDTLGYHLPLAIQPYQDGVIQDVNSPVYWINYYPRAVETLWYWTLEIGRSDLLFNVIQLLFGLQLLLAALKLMRRLSMEPVAIAISLLLITTMPLFYILTTTGYVDIAYASSALSIVAWLFQADDDQSVATSITQAMLALTLSALIKVPIVSSMFFLILIIALLYKYTRQRSLVDFAKAVTSPWSLTPVIAIILGFYRYIYYLFIYHNPLYPLNVKLGPLVLSGPLDASKYGMGASTSMGDPSKMDFFQRLYSASADIFTPLNLDSFGSTGLVYITAVMLGILLFIYFSFQDKNYWHRILAILFLLGCCIPGIFLPRYGMPIISIGIICAIYAYSHAFEPNSKKLMYKLVASLAVIGLISPGLYIYRSLGYTLIHHASINRSLVFTRNVFLVEKIDTGEQSYPSAEVIHYLKENSHINDVLVWGDIDCFQGLMWNRTYSNKSIYLPKDIKDESAWLAKVVQLNAKHIVLYKKDVSASLNNDLTGLNYKLVLDSTRADIHTVVFEKQLKS